MAVVIRGKFRNRMQIYKSNGVYVYQDLALANRNNISKRASKKSQELVITGSPVINADSERKISQKSPPVIYKKYSACDSSSKNVMMLHSMKSSPSCNTNMVGMKGLINRGKKVAPAGINSKSKNINSSPLMSDKGYKPQTILLENGSTQPSVKSLSNFTSGVEKESQNFSKQNILLPDATKLGDKNGVPVTALHPLSDKAAVCHGSPDMILPHNNAEELVSPLTVHKQPLDEVVTHLGVQCVMIPESSGASHPPLVPSLKNTTVTASGNTGDTEKLRMSSVNNCLGMSDLSVYSEIHNRSASRNIFNNNEDNMPASQGLQCELKIASVYSLKQSSTHKKSCSSETLSCEENTFNLKTKCLEHERVKSRSKFGEKSKLTVHNRSISNIVSERKKKALNDQKDIIERSELMVNNAPVAPPQPRGHLESMDGLDCSDKEMTHEEESLFVLTGIINDEMTVSQNSDASGQSHGYVNVAPEIVTRDGSVESTRARGHIEQSIKSSPKLNVNGHSNSIKMFENNSQDNITEGADHSFETCTTMSEHTSITEDRNKSFENCTTMSERNIVNTPVYVDSQFGEKTNVPGLKIVATCDKQQAIRTVTPISVDIMRSNLRPNKVKHNLKSSVKNERRADKEHIFVHTGILEHKRVINQKSDESSCGSSEQSNNSDKRCAPKIINVERRNDTNYAVEQKNQNVQTNPKHSARENGKQSRISECKSSLANDHITQSTGQISEKSKVVSEHNSLNIVNGNDKYFVREKLSTNSSQTEKSVSRKATNTSTATLGTNKKSSNTKHKSETFKKTYNNLDGILEDKEKNKQNFNKIVSTAQRQSNNNVDFSSETINLDRINKSDHVAEQVEQNVQKNVENVEMSECTTLHSKDRNTHKMGQEYVNYTSAPEHDSDNMVVNSSDKFCEKTAVTDLNSLCSKAEKSAVRTQAYTATNNGTVKSNQCLGSMEHDLQAQKRIVRNWSEGTLHVAVHIGTQKEKMKINPNHGKTFCNSHEQSYDCGSSYPDLINVTESNVNNFPKGLNKRIVGKYPKHGIRENDKQDKKSEKKCLPAEGSVTVERDKNSENYNLINTAVNIVDNLCEREADSAANSGHNHSDTTEVKSHANTNAESVGPRKVNPHLEAPKKKLKSWDEDLRCFAIASPLHSKTLAPDSAHEPDVRQRMKSRECRKTKDSENVNVGRIILRRRSSSGEIHFNPCSTQAETLLKSVVDAVFELLSTEDSQTLFDRALHLEAAMYEVNPAVCYNLQYSDFPCKSCVKISDEQQGIWQSVTKLLKHHQTCPGRGCMKCYYLRAQYVHIVLFRHRCEVWKAFTKVLSMHSQYCGNMDCKVYFCKFMKHELKLLGVDIMSCHSKKERNALAKEHLLCQKMGSHGADLHCCNENFMVLPMLSSKEQRDFNAEAQDLEDAANMFVQVES